ncbi:hypothetical protein [Halioxenophilus aromaticivorans]|uniref:Uncharacterized protein n=1 Tax=Halioxenophilus aromaticivorans TaxID=1306992 RepID=A0AAV3U0G5_9ALTE
MHPTIAAWLESSPKQLDEIYRTASAGNIPTGDTAGTAILAGKGQVTQWVAKLAAWLFWRGKIFDMFADDGEKGILVNKVSWYSVSLIVAKVYRQNSWLDGAPCIVIDYASTSLLARKIRDEIREVEPGVWLGNVWWGKTHILNFALSQKTVQG